MARHIMVFACFTPKPAHTAPHAAPPKFTEAHEPRMVENTLAKEEPVAAEEQPAAPAAGHHNRSSSKGAKSFVKKLGDSADKREHLANLLKEHCLMVGGDTNVTQWLKEEGVNASLPSILKALEDTKANDLLFWASRYHLFVSWSPDGSHPWDCLPAAGQHATLEIGSLRGSPDKIVVLLDGKPITDYTMTNSVLKTTSPIEWETPNGQTAKVNLQLQFSAFFGYQAAEAQQVGYLGLQCHGILWPVQDADLPHYWPIAPPIVSGKVNTASRDAVVSPGAGDSLAAFAGTYASHLLPAQDGEQTQPGAEIAITVKAAGNAEVAVGGRDLACWTFDACNVLAWRDEAGYSAWLQFAALPGGPVFMGTLAPSAGDAPATAGKYSVFGELLSQPSRLAPNAAVDCSVGALVASGLATSATLLCASLLRSATRCWALMRGGMSAEDVLMEEEAMLQSMRADFQSLERVQAMHKAAAAVFPAAASALKEMAPAATEDAIAAESDAADHAQAARVSAEAVAAAVTLTNDCIKDGNAVEATSKAAASAWRSGQAASAAAAAEETALWAAKHAAEANTSAARAAAVSAAQSYNLARESALAAARAEAAAAGNALKTVETGIAYYAQRKEYMKLKDIAEASDVAGKALAFAREAVAGYEACTAASREAALDATRQASDFSQLAHKLMRAVYKK